MPEYLRVRLHWAHGLPLTLDMSRKYKRGLEAHCRNIYACLQDWTKCYKLPGEFVWAMDPFRELSSLVLNTYGYTYLPL